MKKITIQKMGKIAAVSMMSMLVGITFSGCGSAPECNDEAVKAKVKDEVNNFISTVMNLGVAAGEISADDLALVQQFLKSNIDSVTTELSDKKAKKSMCSAKISIPIPGDKKTATIKYSAKFTDDKKVIVEVEDYGTLFDN